MSDKMKEAGPFAKCMYCSSPIPVSHHTNVPAVNDDAGWKELEEWHTKDCRWLRTRAHKIVVEDMKDEDEGRMTLSVSGNMMNLLDEIQMDKGENHKYKTMAGITTELFQKEWEIQNWKNRALKAEAKLEGK